LACAVGMCLELWRDHIFLCCWSRSVWVREKRKTVVFFSKWWWWWWRTAHRVGLRVYTVEESGVWFIIYMESSSSGRVCPWTN
jgi:hypothetical protein